MQNKLYQIVGHTFSNRDLITEALTHLSYANEHNTTSYERLEYLGDALLDFVVAEYLYAHYDVQAGELSKYRAKLVNAQILGGIVINSGLSKYVLTGKSVQKVSHNIYADVFESVLASIYLDGGDYRKFVNDMLLVNNEHVQSIIEEVVDYKTKFQEMMQSAHVEYHYQVVSKTGADNNTLFTVDLYVAGKVVASASARSIKLAEARCAQLALANISKKA